MNATQQLPEGILPKYEEVYLMVKDLPVNRRKYNGDNVSGLSWVHGEEPQLIVGKESSPWTENIRFSDIDLALIGNV